MDVPAGPAAGSTGNLPQMIALTFLGLIAFTWVASEVLEVAHGDKPPTEIEYTEPE